MLQLLRSGTMTTASAAGFSLSEAGTAELHADIAAYRDKIILRPQEISNHPEVIRRLGCLAMNGMIEADIYGKVISSHIMGSRICNGIGGSGDFARNAHVAMFLTPSTAKNGTISCLVPMVSHVDHTEHDVHVIITEPGIADLRGLPPHAAPSRSSTTAPTPTTSPRCRTTSTARPPPDPASTPPTCSARHSHGMCATCKKAQCGPTDIAHHRTASNRSPCSFAARNRPGDEPCAQYRVFWTRYFT
jgi:hypothetical protein